MKKSDEKRRNALANEAEKSILVALTLLGASIKSSRKIVFEGYEYRSNADFCPSTAQIFGGPRRAQRLMRLIHAIKVLAARPGCDHWWGVMAKPLSFLAEEFPPLRSDIWAIEHGCRFHVWTRRHWAL